MEAMSKDEMWELIRQHREDLEAEAGERQVMAKERQVMAKERLRAPFPWFGGKSRVADLIWKRLGAVDNYVEPFFGSGAVLLAREEWQGKTETINDKDGFVSNFWRSIQAEPEAVAQYANWPVNENDLHARHYWLVQQKETLTQKLEADLKYYNAEIAGYWVWGMCAWIGGGFCSGDGPWQVQDGVLVKLKEAGQGINKQRPHLSYAGQGINKQRPHLGDAAAWFSSLSDRLRKVRVCSGDWARVCTPCVTVHNGLTGVFLDPPYAADRSEVYTVDDFAIANTVREWCRSNGNDPRLRIALCGYEGEHEELQELGWSVHKWKAVNGYNSSNGHKERIWFSPHCVPETRHIQCSILDELRNIQEV